MPDYGRNGQSDRSALRERCGEYCCYNRNGQWFCSVASSPAAVISAEQTQFNVMLKGGATAYLSLNQSSVTLQGNNLAATYFNQFVSNSQFPHSFIGYSQFPNTNLQLLQPIFNKANILPVAG